MTPHLILVDFEALSNPADICSLYLGAECQEGRAGGRRGEAEGAAGEGHARPTGEAQQGNLQYALSSDILSNVRAFTCQAKI